MSHAKRDTTEEEWWGGDQRLWKWWGRGRQVPQGIRSFAAFMFQFLRLTLQMSHGNPSNKSQLKLTTKPVVSSPSKLSLKTISAAPSTAKLWLIIAHYKVGHTAETRSEKCNYFFVLLKVFETLVSRAVTLNQVFSWPFHFNNIVVIVNINIHFSTCCWHIIWTFNCDLQATFARKK